MVETATPAPAVPAARMVDPSPTPPAVVEARTAEPAATPEVVVSSNGDEYQGLPADEGRDLVLGLCGACHSMKLVTQQGLSRSTWSEVLEFMVEEQEMPELAAEDEKLVLDYLEKFYGPDRRAVKMKRTGRPSPADLQPTGVDSDSSE